MNKSILDAVLAGRCGAVFPNVENADRDGLLCYGGNLDPEILLCAYAQGIFPWFNEDDPILWWSPDPRCVLFPHEFHISARSLRKIRQSGFDFSMDRAFEEVMRACAAPREAGGGTWISAQMLAAYCRLHALGFAHSVEIWQGDALVGGLYGVAIGRILFGESMFHRVNEASRAALCALTEMAQRENFALIDCQQATPHMLKMGARTIPRRQFTEIVAAGVREEGVEGWRKELRPFDGKKILIPASALSLVNGQY